MNKKITSIRPAAAFAQKRFLDIQSIAMEVGLPIIAVGTNSEELWPFIWILLRPPFFKERKTLSE